MIVPGAPDMAWFPANDTELLSDSNYVFNVLEYISELNESLSREQIKCLERESQDQNRKRLECEVNWDTILCWPRTPSGTLATIPCFDELNGIPYDNTREYTCVIFTYNPCQNDGDIFRKTKLRSLMINI